MGPAIYLIAILGCGEGTEPCEQIGLAPARYESQSACMAATEAQLMRNSDHPYPIVVAECRRSGADPRPIMPEELLLPDADATRALPRPARSGRQLARR